MEFDQYFNFAEALLWFVIAAVLFVKGWGSQFRALALFSTLIIFFFGVSDLVEVWSRAWWQPWWLLVWKMICGVGMLLSLIYYFRKKKVMQSSPESLDSGEKS